MFIPLLVPGLNLKKCGSREGPTEGAIGERFVLFTNTQSVKK